MSDLFRPAALSARRRQLFGEVMLTTPRFGSWCAAAGGLLLCALGLLLMLGNYRARESVTGYLTSEQGMIQVRPEKAGRIAQQLVVEGQQVTAGQALYQLVVESWTDQQRLEDARLGASQAQLDQAIEAISRHHERRELERTHLSQSIISATARLDALGAQLADSGSQLALASAQFDVAHRARDQGLISLMDYQRAQIARGEAAMAKREAQLRLAQQRQSLRDLTHQQQLAPIGSGQQLAALSRQLSEAKTAQLALRYDNRFVLTAPVTGRVTGLVGSVGQWALPGQVMATVQRPAPLVARLLVPTRAAGRVEVGQTARLQLAAFPYQKHGLLQARISQVSTALVEAAELPPGLSLKEPAYWVTAEFDPGGALSGLAVRPGMVLNADLLREQRRIWQWLAEPLLTLRS